MTPNGAVAFCLLLIAAALVAGNITGLAIALTVTLIFALGSRQNVVPALARSVAIVLPLALFMGIVWIGIVGRAPHEIAANIEGSREAATAYVATICARLFIITLAIQAALLHFAGWTPLAFVRALTAPAVVKKLIVLTLSLVETMLHAIDRARTALIAGGIITRGHSWRNLRNGWLLVQTVWLTVITIVIGRMRDKWPIENTIAHLDDTLAGTAPWFAAADAGWLAVGTAGLAIAWGLR